MLNVKSISVSVRVVVALGFLCVLLTASISTIAYNRIQNAGSDLAQRQILNFTGTGVSCADNSGSSRTDCTINGTGVANFNQAFTSATSVTITHNLGTTAVLTQCFDNATPPNWIIPANIAITDSNTVTVTFSSAQSGSCTVNGAAAGVASSVPFGGITTGSNTTATMTVGTGGSIVPSGSGTINATQVNGTSIPSGSSGDQIVVTTASDTGSWASMPNCSTALTYSTSTHTPGCASGVVPILATWTTADATNVSGTTLTPIGVSITLAANHTYLWTAHVSVTTNSPTSGYKIALAGTATIGGVGYWRVTESDSAATGSYGNPFNTMPNGTIDQTAFASGAASAAVFDFSGVVTPTVGGTFLVQMAQHTASGILDVRAGSYAQAIQIN
jgi:hypothetical protein